MKLCTIENQAIELEFSVASDRDRLGDAVNIGFQHFPNVLTKWDVKSACAFPIDPELLFGSQIHRNDSLAIRLHDQSMGVVRRFNYQHMAYSFVLPGSTVEF